MVLKNSEKREISKRYHAGETIDEISKKMDMSPTTVQKYKDFAPGLETAAPTPTASEAPNLSNLTEEPEWVRKLFNKINTLEEQVNNQIPQAAAAPSLEQPVTQLRDYETDNQRFLRSVLLNSKLDAKFIDYQVRMVALKGDTLPSPEELSDATFKWMKGDWKFASLIDTLYRAEISNRYRNPNPQLKVVPSNVMIQNPDGTISNPSQNPQSLASELRNHLEIDRLIHGTREATPPSPELERVSGELAELRRERNEDRTAQMQDIKSQLQREYGEKIHLADAYRTLQERMREIGKTPTENDVKMKELEEKYAFENKKRGDKKESSKGWQTVAKDILTPILPAIMRTADELEQERQQMSMQQPPGQITEQQQMQPYQPYPDEQLPPDNPPTDEQLPLDNPPPEHFPPASMIMVPCPYCKENVTFNATEKRVTCPNPKCGKQLQVNYPPGTPPQTIDIQPIDIPLEKVQQKEPLPIEQADKIPPESSVEETVDISTAQPETPPVTETPTLVNSSNEIPPDKTVETEKNPVWRRGDERFKQPPSEKKIEPPPSPSPSAETPEKTESPEITEKTENTEITEKTQPVDEKPESIKTSNEKSVASSATKKKTKQKKVKSNE